MEMSYWCESCARKSNCYTIRSRPKCFMPITNSERIAEQTEPSDNSCKTCRYGEVDEGYVLCKYYSKDEQTEPQKEVKGSERLLKSSDARKFLGYACETCKHRDEEWDSEACDGCCENNDHYEPQTNADQRTQCVESVETMSCQECKHWIFDDRWGWFCPLKSQDECRYEPKDEPNCSEIPNNCKDEPQTDCSWK